MLELAIAGGSFRCYKNSILSVVFPPQSLPAVLNFRDDQGSFVLVLQIKSSWYTDGKWSEKRIQVSPLQYSLPLDNIALAVQGLDEELVPDSAVTSGAL